MNTVVWIARSLLVGAMKLAKPKADLQTSGMAWVEDFPQPQVKGIGALEVLAAIGLILPALLDLVAPVLVGVAAVGVVLLMFGAAATHVRRGESQMVPVNLAINAIAVFIAVMRFGLEAF